MPVQSLPPSAERYARTQRQEIGAAVSAVARTWRRMTPEFDASYLSIEQTLLAITATAQRRVAAGAQEYVPAVLEDTGQARAARPFADVMTEPLFGVAGDGRPIDTLLYESVIGAKVSMAGGSTSGQALARSGQWLTQAVGTLLSDTGRASESLAMGVRPVGGYVRMLNPPSCSRCAVLAGKWFRKNAGFQRHPGCDCRHIPASESVAGDLTVDTFDYFHSLDAAEQDRIFGKAGASAIREGADIGQVVNARRGMQYAGQTSTTSREMWVRKPDGSVVWESRTVNVSRRTAQASQIGGRDVLVTTEGTTRRGQAYRSLATSGTSVDRTRTAIRITRNGPELRTIERTVARRPRLMPETIARVATGRDDYLRLLRANGYL